MFLEFWISLIQEFKVCVAAV